MNPAAVQTKKITVLNISFEDRLTGLTKRVLDVACGLTAIGVQTTICLPDRGGSAHSAATERNIPVCSLTIERIPRLNKIMRLCRWVFFFPRDVLHFIRVFRTERPDIVHVNGVFFLPPAIAAKLVAIPLIWHLNDTIVPKRLAVVLGKVVDLLADQIVVAAEAVANHYSVNNSTYRVIYAPVDLKKFAGVTDNLSKTNRKTLRVGLIANWSPVKGIEFFVKALALVRDKINTKLEIVFAGEKMATQQEYCNRIDMLISTLGLENNVEHLGFVSAVEDVIMSLNILVVSSNSEACPISVLEAMAAGVPVVATDVGGVKELLKPDEEKKAGIVVPPQNPEAIADAILYLWDNPTASYRLGKNGAQLAMLYFSLQICVDNHQLIYEEVLRKKKRINHIDDTL
jgi:glycosyltransferase involved in cell wall biosynthesis